MMSDWHDTLFVIVFVVVLLAVVGGVFWHVLTGPRQAAPPAWRHLAEHLGLTFRPAGSRRGRRRSKSRLPIVDGHYRDRAVTLTYYWAANRNYTKASVLGGHVTFSLGNSQQQMYTRLTVSVKSLGADRLFLTEKRMFRQIVEFLGLDGGELWQSGDDDFDNRLEVRSTRTELADQALADPHLRERLLAVLDNRHLAHVIVEKTRVRWETVRKNYDHHLLTVALDTLCDMAEKVERTEEGPKGRSPASSY
jgi:hypothetical protein